MRFLVLVSRTPATGRRSTEDPTGHSPWWPARSSRAISTRPAHRPRSQPRPARATVTLISAFFVPVPGIGGGQPGEDSPSPTTTTKGAGTDDENLTNRSQVR